MGPFGLPKSARLLKATEYREVVRAGKRRHTASFVVYWRQNGLEGSRLGLSAGSGVGAAPRRNRIKRLVREFFRLNRGGFTAPVDVHVQVKRAAPVASLGDVARELGFFLCAAPSARQGVGGPAARALKI